jgi:hypothetical protein
MMTQSWLKTILCGHVNRIVLNTGKTGFSEIKI